MPTPEAHIATGVGAFEGPVVADAHTVVMEGSNREVTVSGRPALMDEETAYWQYGVNLGRLIGVYELPSDETTARAISDHSIYIFDDTNPNAKHAAEKQYTIISKGALQALGDHNLGSRRDTFKHPDLIQISEGQKLDVGRQWRWLPKEARAALKHEKRRVMSDNQAEFYVQAGELKLRTHGYNGGLFTAVPGQEAQARKQAERAYQRAMRQQMIAGKPTSRLASVPHNEPTAPAVQVHDAYISALGRPAEARGTTQGATRHAVRLGSLLRRPVKNSTTARHDFGGGLRRTLRHNRRSLK